MVSPFDLTGDVALVVGAASGGLGERAARALADSGATVVRADLEPDAQGDLLHVDVTDEASVQALVATVLARHGRMDVLVNAAGVMLRKAYDETTVAEFEHVVRVNLTGSWLLAREVAPALGDAGRIVNLSTVYAERVGPIPESAYYASKAGVANVTRALAAELGPRGITVNCLAPGVFYPTKMTAALSADPERLQWFCDRTMLRRLGDPDADFAGPLLFLASIASSYVTGQVLYVDGGWSAW